MFSPPRRDEQGQPAVQYTVGEDRQCPFERGPDSRSRPPGEARTVQRKRAVTRRTGGFAEICARVGPPCFACCDKTSRDDRQCDTPADRGSQDLSNKATVRCARAPGKPGPFSVMGEFSAGRRFSEIRSRWACMFCPPRRDERGQPALQYTVGEDRQCSFERGQDSGSRPPGEAGTVQRKR